MVLAGVVTRNRDAARPRWIDAQLHVLGPVEEAQISEQMFVGSEFHRFLVQADASTDDHSGEQLVQVARIMQIRNTRRNRGVAP